jgi:hypothetical protein
MAFGARFGFAKDIQKHIVSEFQSNGLHDTVQTQYESLQDSETAARSAPIARIWQLGSFKVRIPIIYARGKDGEVRKAEELG